MPSTQSIFLSTSLAVMATAQYTTQVASSASSYGPQDWQQWNTWGQSASSSQPAYTSSSASSHAYSALSTHIPIPVSTYPVVSTSTSSGPYENPFTVYLSQTNSLGVVTGMPSVVTSQPQVVTSQASAASVPAGVVVTTSSAVSTLLTTTRVNPSSSITANSTFNQNGSNTSSAPIASHTGAASSFRNAAMSGVSTALVVAGVIFSFL